MLNHAAIARLVPHQGAMCLLDGVVAWDAEHIHCRAVSHLRAHHPLLRDGRLGLVCGIEYGLQAGAVHGALVQCGGASVRGYLAVLRDVSFGGLERLDDAGLGVLQITAWLERSEPGGSIYRFRLGAEDGCLLVAGRAVIGVRDNDGS